MQLTTNHIASMARATFSKVLITTKKRVIIKCPDGRFAAVLLRHLEREGCSCDVQTSNKTCSCYIQVWH